MTTNQNNQTQNNEYKELFVKEVNNKFLELNVPETFLVKSVNEYLDFVTLIKNENNKFGWVSNELFEYVETKSFELSVNIPVVLPGQNPSNFDFVNNDYDIEYEKTNFLLNLNTELKKFAIPNDISINNVSEFNSLKTLIKNFVPNPAIPTTITSWLNNPLLKKFINNKDEAFDNLINPEKNALLSSKLLIDTNLEKFKDILNLDKIPSIDQLQNIINFPSDFDINQLSNLLKTPDLNIESFDDIKNMLNLPDLNLSLSNLTNINIPNIGNIALPTISGLTTGLNFDRMLSTMQKAQLKDFPETTPWSDVIKFQTAQVTKAFFDELSKMTLYIEPGEIKVLTNGSPSTHQGKNINRIKIKLK